MMGGLIASLTRSRGTLSVGALALIGIGACGARTSIVDERYGFGEGGTPPAHVMSGGAAGQSGALAFDPSLATKPCNGYCQSYGKTCPDRLDPGQDCSASCEREVNSAGSQCQALGIAALECLAPFYQSTGCWTNLTDGLNSCGDRVDSFEQCAGALAASVLPIVDPAKCSNVYSGSPGLYCSEGFDCAGRRFGIWCDAVDTMGSATCRCGETDGQVAFRFSTANRCLHTAAICAR